MNQALIKHGAQFGRIYGRFSSKPQERGDSKRQQIDGAHEYAKRNNINIVGSAYFDEAVSGKAGKNLEKEFGRLLREVQPGEVVLVEYMDRLGRQNPFLLGKLIYDLVMMGASLNVWHENKIIDRQNIEEFATQITTFTGAAVGNAENLRKIKRLRETTDEAYRLAEKGIQTGTLIKFLPKTFLWDEQNKKIVIDEVRANVVRRVFNLWCSGMGKTIICQTLNTEGVPTLQSLSEARRGKADMQTGKWIEISVKKILKCESFAGVLNVKGKRFTCIPTIIDRKQFDKAQLLLDRYTNRHGKCSGPSRVNNLFRGVAVCAHCGGVIDAHVSQPSKKFPHRKTCYLFACRKAKTGACPSNDNQMKRKMMNGRIVELAFFTQYFGGSPENHLVVTSNEMKTQIAALQSKIQKLDKAIENLYGMVEEGDLTAKDRIIQRRLEKADAEKELMLAKGNVIEQNNLPTMLDEVDTLIGTPEGSKAIQEFYPKLQAKLSDNETRTKLVNLMPSIFSKVLFDTVNKTLQPITKQGKELPLVDLNTFEE